MKSIFFAILVVLCQLPSWSASASAQSAASPASSTPSPPAMILVTISWWGNLLGTPFLQASFDTGGKGLANFSEAELNKKYAKVPMPASPASIVNFLVQSGYRMVSFSTMQGGAGPDASRYSVTNGYVFLCEQVR